MNDSIRHVDSFERQAVFFREAERERFRWLTTNPVVASAERRLLSRWTPFVDGARMLEVGCGEGANLATLRSVGAAPRYVGFDAFAGKIRFAREALGSSAKFLVGDCRKGFPFRDAAFDVVLVRDVLHHVESADRTVVIVESLRVLRSGGRLIIVEGNADNPLNRVFSWLFPHERSLVETRTLALRGLIEQSAGGRAADIDIRMEEPSNAFRLLLHYRFGFAGLAHHRAVARGLDWLDRRGRRRGERRTWAYSICQVTRA